MLSGLNPAAMTPAEFKRKWHRYQGKKSSAYQEGKEKEHGRSLPPTAPLSRIAAQSAAAGRLRFRPLHRPHQFQWRSQTAVTNSLHPRLDPCNKGEFYGPVLYTLSFKRNFGRLGVGAW